MLERIKKKLLNRSAKKEGTDKAMATKKKAAKKKAAAKATAKKAVTKKATAKKATTKKAAAKKATAKKAVSKKTASKKAATKKAAAKKSVAKKATAKKAAAKKATASKASAKKKAVSKAKTAPKKKAATPKTSTKVASAKPMNTGLSSQLQQFSDFTPYESSKGEEYMNEEMKNHFRHILYTWRSELMQEVDRTVGHMKDEASNFADPNDRATQEEEFALELRTRDRERKLIRKINKTLDRIDEDDYGWCDQCGIEIGVRRLEARPTADLCIDCKTLDEIREKQTRL